VRPPGGHTRAQRAAGGGWSGCDSESGRFRKAQSKGAMRHRVLAGLKEVGQAVRSGRAKCVVLAPNVEEVSGAGEERGMRGGW
ncbi:unnamed protein product, partial [Closterium sp. Naga37s-1]